MLYNATIVTDPKTFKEWYGFVMKDLNRYCGTITGASEPYILYRVTQIGHHDIRLAYYLGKTFRSFLKTFSQFKVNDCEKVHTTISIASLYLGYEYRKCYQQECMSLT